LIQIQLSGTKDDTLLNLLVKAHQDAARNNPNASAELCKVATEGSGDFTKGVIAGLAATGGAHAPLGAARDIYINGLPDHANLSGYRVPGFGNSFYKDKIDPAFVPTTTHIRNVHTKHFERIVKLVEDVQKIRRVRLQPNAALITAAVCEILEIPRGVEGVIFMLARIPVWAEDCASTN
jgi:citrate synthase